jgi:peptide chain release factor 2
LKNKSKTSWCDFDLEEKEQHLQKLEEESQSPELWDDPEQAQRTLRQLSSVKEEIDEWLPLKHKISEALELARLDDESLRPDLEKETAWLEKELGKKELKAMLSGEYDRGNAILAIHAGAGGTDSQDWAEILQRMYLRWAETHGYETDILDFSEGEEAGIKSTTIAINGPYAFGYLKSEKGVHRLVRLSPFDAAHRRHTSFALVEILPQVEDASDIRIAPDDIRIDVYRSSGAGGQNVQKNMTAVRITHLPSGLVVTCQNERSQNQNRENAMRVLRARLVEQQELERAKELSDLRGEYTKAEWGSQIRSYVLHPYQMVKDHRTETEVGNAQSVLNGGIDPFIEAYLRHSLGNGR